MTEDVNRFVLRVNIFVLLYHLSTQICDIKNWRK